MPHRPGRRQALATGAALIAAPLVGRAQNSTRYPEKAVRIIVPFPAGGSVDALGRAIGQKMQENWGVPVTVENRAGASTLIGTDAVAKAAPDGHTLLIAVSNHTTNPAMQASLPYDTLKDLAPISMMARAPVVAYAGPQFGASDLKGLVSLARAKPGELGFGSAGAGSMTHLTAELFKLAAGVDLTHILYKGGTPAMLDVMAGHLPLTFATVGQALPQYRAGKLKALAISSDKRYASVPDIPTFREQGFDVVTTEWFGLFAPGRTPRDIIDKLNAEVRRILALPGLGDRLTATELGASTPEELDAFVKSEIARWSPLIGRLGLKAG